jgi:hypothetical protein
MVADSTEDRPLPLTLRLTIAAAGLLVAAVLAWLAVSTHLARACTVMDTPYLPLCRDPETLSKPERTAMLAARVARNPGDSDAWIRLTHVDRSAREKSLLSAAFALAPTDTNVLMWRVGDALQRSDEPMAIGLLVQLIEQRGKAEAAQALAQIVASGSGTQLLLPYLASAEKWLPSVLITLPAMKLPIESALPLLAHASERKTVSQRTVDSFIRDLKTAGRWADAYGLWLAQQKEATPLLHNGGFDHLFQPDGFDWEVTPVLPSKAGAIVTQRNLTRRGPVIEVEFTGRAVTVPLLRQYLFLAPGKYLLRGSFMSSRLRTEQGLAWLGRCINSKSAKAVAGRSAGLTDTAGVWQQFQFELLVPADCGLVTSLQLETSAPSEAAAGFKGRAYFDAFELRVKAL